MIRNLKSIGTAAVVLLAVASSLVVAQRSSPQFSFPPPSSDLFSANGQDLGPLNGQSQQQQQQQQQQSHSQAEQPQLVAQSISQPAQASFTASNSPANSASQSPLSQRQPAQLPAARQPSQQQQALASNIQSAAAAASSVVGNQASQSNSRHNSRPSAQQSSSGSSSHSSAAAHQHNHQHHQHQTAAPSSQSNRHPANIQTQATSQSGSRYQSQQVAMDAARKAEATAASLAAGAGQSYQCPDSFGYFRHHKSCDKYYACENGTATLKLCGNGLMFDDSDPKRENCAYPFSVDCGSDRVDVEPPISTPHCPRLYGLFADTSNCRIFYSCWNGEASKYECPAGLAYDNEHRVCVWADHVDRCDQSEISDGFACPDPTEADQPGHYTRHAHPTDCRKFYVCIEGVARPYGCSIGTVFNVDSLQCDEPENVGGCEKYYGDLDPKLAKKLSRENVQQSNGGAPSRATISAASASQTGLSTGSRGPAATSQPTSS